MITATATNTTNRDASATVVTKARLRRLGRPRVRKAGWTGSRGSGGVLACSHRASGHDVDKGVPSQFGIGGGRFRSIRAPRPVRAATSLRARPPTLPRVPMPGPARRAPWRPPSHRTVASCLTRSPTPRRSAAARARSDARPERRASAPSCSCWGRGRSRCCVGWWYQWWRFHSMEVGAPEGKSLRMSPGQSPWKARKRPGGPQGAVALRFCSSALRVVCSWVASVSNCFRKAPSCRGGSESMVSRNWRSWRTCASALTHRTGPERGPCSLTGASRRAAATRCRS